MKLDTHLTAIALPDARVGDFAFDGKFYYFTVFGQGRILQYTEDFLYCREFFTCRVYECLCFDWEDCCFWGTVAGCATRLFQLDCQFQEIACVSLDLPLGGRITGLCYSGCSQGLLLAFPTGLGVYGKETGEFSLYPPVRGLISSVLALCTGYLVLATRRREQVLYTYLETGELIYETVLPRGYVVQDLCYNPCYCDTARLDFLLREGCYTKISSIPVTSYELGFLPCICQHKLCQYCCEGLFPPECCEGGLTDVIESIAMVEVSLSHILNAQGEEIQLAVAEDASVEELLALNSEINLTIEKVTALEEILCSKLGEVKEITELRGCCGEKDCDTTTVSLIE